ncbi:MAG: LysO family transporter [Alistipes sp.]|nr:LysO family transporter [Alistipes sp.]
MIEIILVMVSGIVAGRLLRRVKALRVLPVTTMATIVVLLFIMGGEIGGNRDVIAGLSTSGVEALAIAAAATLGSIAAARGVYALFFANRNNTTHAGNEK